MPIDVDALCSLLGYNLAIRNPGLCSSSLLSLLRNWPQRWRYELDVQAYLRHRRLSYNSLVGSYTPTIAISVDKGQQRRSLELSLQAWRRVTKKNVSVKSRRLLRTVCVGGGHQSHRVSSLCMLCTQHMRGSLLAQPLSAHRPWQAPDHADQPNISH